MMQTAMQQSVQKTLKLSRQRLNSLAEKRVLQSPLNYVEDRRVLLDFLSTRLHAAGQKTLHEKKQRFVRLTAALDAMSPLKVLSRGYSMVTDETGTLVTSAGSRNNRPAHPCQPAQRQSDGAGRADTGGRQECLKNP